MGTRRLRLPRHTRWSRSRANRWLVSALVMTFVLTGCDWAMFGYDQSHSRYNAFDKATSTTNVRELVTLWRGATNAAVSSSPAVVNGVVYVGSNDGSLYAFDAKSTTGCSLYTCTPLWTAPTGGAVSSSPAVVNGVAYVGSEDGKLYAFDANGSNACSGSPITCAPLWIGAAGTRIRSSPAVANGVVYVGTDDGNLVAFDAKGERGCTSVPPTGVPVICAPIWVAPTGGAVRSSPAVESGVVYVGSDDGRLYAFDAAGMTGCTGTPGTPAICGSRWTALTGGPIQSSPAVVNGVVYVGSDDGRLYAFDASGTIGCTGTPVVCAPAWISARGGPIASSPAVADNVVYIGSDDGRLSAYDTTDRTQCSTVTVVCSPSWIAETGGPVRSSPTVAGGVVYIGTADGHLSGYPTLAGSNCGGAPLVCTPLRSVAIGSAVTSSPAIASGIIYVGSSAGSLISARPVVTPIDPTLSGDLLTPEANDSYGVAVSGGGTVASAPGSNVGLNTRVVFRRIADPPAANEQTCATWSSQSSNINQQGAALRISESADGVRRAITITKNVWFLAGWIFNVHVWDTGTAGVATQIASFDLASAFRPGGQQLPLPWRICARAVGETISFIVWPVNEAQPPWTDTTHGGSVTLPAGWNYAGTPGWYVGHLPPENAASFTEMSSEAIPEPGAPGSGPVSSRPIATTPARRPTAIHQLP